jgi:hypothetical protein
MIIHVARITLAMSLFAGVQTGFTAQADDVLARVAIGGHVYFPDGHSVATWRTFDKRARTIPGANQIYTTRSLCVFNNTDGLSLNDAGYGWTFDATLVKRAADGATVHVNWSRTKDRGQLSDSPSAAVDLVLTSGTSIPLDYIVPGPQTGPGSQCDAIGMLLEITLSK